MEVIMYKQFFLALSLLAAMPTQAIDFASIYNKTSSLAKKAYNGIGLPLAIAAVANAGCAAWEIAENYQDKFYSQQLVSQIAKEPSAAITNYIFVSALLSQYNIPFETRDIFKPELVIEKLHIANERWSAFNLPITRALLGASLVGLAAYKLAHYCFSKKNK
jgi:NO-binding membrane sensor protein with MHYT domain